MRERRAGDDRRHVHRVALEEFADRAAHVLQVAAPRSNSPGLRSIGR